MGHRVATVFLTPCCLHFSSPLLPRGHVETVQGWFSFLSGINDIKLQHIKNKLDVILHESTHLFNYSLNEEARPSTRHPALNHDYTSTFLPHCHQFLKSGSCGFLSRCQWLEPRGWHLSRLKLWGSARLFWYWSVWCHHGKNVKSPLQRKHFGFCTDWQRNLNVSPNYLK